MFVPRHETTRSRCPALLEQGQRWWHDVAPPFARTRCQRPAPNRTLPPGLQLKSAPPPLKALTQLKSGRFLVLHCNILNHAASSTVPAANLVRTSQSPASTMASARHALLLAAAMSALAVSSGDTASELMISIIHARVAAEWAWPGAGAAASSDDSCWGSPRRRSAPSITAWTPKAAPRRVAGCACYCTTTWTPRPACCPRRSTSATAR